MQRTKEGLNLAWRYAFETQKWLITLKQTDILMKFFVVDHHNYGVELRGIIWSGPA